MKTALTLAQTKISFSLIIDKYSKSIIRMCLPTGNCGWTDKMCVDNNTQPHRRHSEVAHRICVRRMTPGGCLRN